jgi:hypothetical protein
VSSALSKIYSIVLNNRGNKWAETHNMRSKSQFGFREEKGTTEPVFISRHIVER